MNEIQILLVYKATLLSNLPVLEQIDSAQCIHFDFFEVSDFVNNFYF